MVPWPEAERLFADCFRREAYRTLEYSLGPDPTRLGLMIGGQEKFTVGVRRFMSRLGIGGDWFWAVERFIGLVRPDTYLFKVDRHEATLDGVTVYCRFPIPVSGDQLAQLFEVCAPLGWRGPSIDALSQVLDVEAPRGIGFRLAPGSAVGSAVYFRVSSTFRKFRRAQLSVLTQLCGFDAAAAAAIGDEVQAFYCSDPVGVIGLDSASDSSPTMLKLDPANVPLRAAIRALVEWETPSGYVSRIEGLAASLRAAVATYFGLKFGPSGFSGWKMYLAVKPTDFRSAGMSHVIGPRELSPALRLPHY